MIDEGKILLVEDNPDDVELTRIALRENRIANDLEVARDGAEAIEILDRGDHLPVVVLLDLNLPKVSGIDVLRHIRSNEKLRMIPVVALTSSDEDRDLIETYKLGVNSYIRKPVDFDEFVSVVKTVGLYWLVLNRFPKLETGDPKT